MVRLVLLIFFLFVFSSVQADTLSLKGWDIYPGTPLTINNSKIRTLHYKPPNLKKNHVFEITIWEPVSTGTSDLESWFIENIERRQQKLGSFSKPVKIGKEKSGALSLANNFKNKAGKKRQVGYQADWTDEGKAYIGQLVASNHMLTVLRFSPQIEKVIQHALTVFASSTNSNFYYLKKDATQTASGDHLAKSTTTESSNARVINDPLDPVGAPPGFAEIRVTGEYGIMVGGLFGLKTEVLALFESGEYTSDLAGLFAGGQSQSKAQNPDEWGRWRKTDGELELNSNKQPEFEKPEAGDWLAEAGTTDQKLNKCFGHIATASSSPYGGGPTVGNASSWCFKTDGRFAHSSTGFVTGGGEAVSGAAASSSKTRGRYRIDGYAVKFIYDDGTQFTAAFKFLSKDKGHIGINGKRYISSK